MEETEAKQGLKINDRRRFDSSGNDKAEADSTPESRPVKPVTEAKIATPVDARSHSEAPKSEAPPARPTNSKPAVERMVQPEISPDSEADLDAGPESIDGGEGLSFHSFIMSLAHQALMLLGEIPGPDGQNFPPDKDAAKQTIDILSMLEHKTKGNLTDEEHHFLEEILHELRLRFVRG